VHVLPPPDQWASLAPTPSSIAWRRAGDARVMVMAGYALLLQVAHPTVGAGVTEHSSFRSDPWGRLLRTLDYTNIMVYGGPEAAAAMGRRLRSFHRPIRGVRPDGRRYHALEPEAYAWVHATLADAIVTGHARFGRPLDVGQRKRFWREWRDLGRLLGVRERDLPADWTAFRAYLDDIVAGRLEHTAAVDDVLDALANPAAPPLPVAARPAWTLAAVPLTHVMGLVTVGMLPAVLRERFGLRSSKAQQLELRLLGHAMRATTPMLPGAVRVSGPGYLRLRRKAIARGDTARVDREPSDASPSSS
jgi:uncharacterized protein (DUF2236 family)